MHSYDNHSIESCREAIFYALKNNSGMKKILYHAYQYLNNPLVVCDTSFSIIDYYPEHNYDLDFDKKNNRYYMRPETIQELKDKSVIQSLHQTSHSFLTTHEITKENMVFCNIKIDNAVIGYICMPEIYKKIDENTFSLIDFLSDIISIEMQKFEFLAKPSGQDYEQFMKELLSCHHRNLPNIDEYLEQFSFQNKHYHWIIIFRSRKHKQQQANLRYLIQQITTILSNCMCINHRGYLTALFSRDDIQPFTAYETTKLSDFLEFNQLFIALSYPFSNIADAPVYYSQALSILGQPLSAQSSPSILYYEDFYLTHILSQFQNQTLLQAAIHPDILRIQEYDRLHNTEYLHTLYCYFQNNRSASETSAFLHIHKSTFFYRLGKISELFDIDLKNSQHLFSYEFSLHILYSR